MFAARKVIDLVPESMKGEFFTNPPPPYVLRDNSIALLEFYHQLQGLFKSRACGAAHHFPGVQDQNPESCPWMRTNPGCTHADTIVSETFRWIEKIVNALNERCGHLIVDPREMQILHDLFLNDFVLHTGSPDLTIYFKQFRRVNPDQPDVFSPEFIEEIERVKTFQKEKSELFFMLCKFLSDRIQEVLLMPDELDRLLPFPE